MSELVIEGLRASVGGKEILRGVDLTLAVVRVRLSGSRTVAKSRSRHAWRSSFIEGWDKPHRRYSAIDYLSPIDYQRT